MDGTTFIRSNGHSDGQFGHHSVDDFGCTTEELCDLMKLKGQEASLAIQRIYGNSLELCRRLGTSPAEGLRGSAADLRLRTDVFGSNVLSSKKKKKKKKNEEEVRRREFLRFLWEATKDITLIILTIAVLLALAIYGYQTHSSSRVEHSNDRKVVVPSWIEQVSLLVTVCSLVLVVTLIDWRKEQVLYDIMETAARLACKVVAVRGGKTVEIPAGSLVVGDICFVRRGDVISADGILIQSNGMKVNERLINGKRDDVTKDVKTDPVLLSGCHVTEGSGKMAVTAVGLNSQLHAIGPHFSSSSSFFTEEPQNSYQTRGMKIPLLVKLDRLTNKRPSDDRPKQFHPQRKSISEIKLIRHAIRMGCAGAIVALLVLVILIARFSIVTFALHPSSSSSSSDDQRPCLEMLIHFLVVAASVFVLVASVRLPLTLGLAIARNAKEMIDAGVLFRRLDICHVPGQVAAILTNKTGTLTANRMKVEQCYMAGSTHDGRVKFGSLPVNAGSLMTKLISINTEYTSMVCQQHGRQRRHVGDETDCALLEFVLDLGHSYEALRSATPDDWICKTYPFNSARKYSSKVVLREGGGFQLFAKGASEVILKKCKWIHGPDGAVFQLSEQHLDSIKRKVMQPMTAAGLRTLCLAHREYVLGTALENQDPCYPEPNWADEDNRVSNLTCIAILGISDPLRPESKDFIDGCRRLGATVRLVSGDDTETVRSVASKCRLMRPDGDGPSSSSSSVLLDANEYNRQIREVHGGPILHQLFDKTLSRLRVLTRTCPDDKHTLVRMMKESSPHSNAVPLVAIIQTSGTDDGEAVERADIIFAMGIAGTEIAKATSDVIITDDNLTNVLRVVEWSRRLQENLLTLVQFQLTTTIVAASVVILASLSIGDVPLKPIHVLWTKIIADPLASLALLSDRATEEFSRSPPDPSMSLFWGRLTVVGHSAYQLVVLVTVLFLGEFLFDVDNGREMSLQSSSSSSSSSEHFTIVFNAFVMMTFFNEINSCKRNNGSGLQHRNVLAASISSRSFVAVWFGQFVTQIFIIQFGGSFLSTSSLTLEQWIWCLAFGIGGLLWAQVLMSFPVRCLLWRRRIGGGEGGGWGGGGRRRRRPFNSRSSNGKLDLELIEKQMEIDAYATDDHDELSYETSLGQVLWSRGITRLQHQLRVARALQNILTDDAGKACTNEGIGAGSSSNIRSIGQSPVNNRCSWPGHTTPNGTRTSREEDSSRFRLLEEPLLKNHQRPSRSGANNNNKSKSADDVTLYHSASVERLRDNHTTVSLPRHAFAN